MGAAEALLAGHTTYAQIAEYIGCAPSSIASHLSDPVAMRWISDQVEAHVGHRLGMVSAAMFARACGGDVAAARLVFERYGKLVNRTDIVHHKGMDLSKLSDSELDTILKSKGIIDIETVHPDERAEGTADPGCDGEGPETTGGTPPVLPADSEAE